MHKSPSPAHVDTHPSPMEMEVEQPEPEPVRDAPVRGEHTVDGLLDHRVHFLFNVDGLKSMVYDFNSGVYEMQNVAFRGPDLRLKNRCASVSFTRNGIHVILVSGGSYSDQVCLYSHEDGGLVGSELPQKLNEAR